MGLFSSLFVLTMLRDVVLLSAAGAAMAWPLGTWRDSLTAASAVAVSALALLFTAWGLLNARRTAAVVRVDVRIAQLPPAQHGFPIAQLSELHV